MKGRRPRSVLVASLRYPPYVAGGYERLTAAIVDGLRGRGHAVTVLSGAGERFAGEGGVLPWLAPSLDSPESEFGHALACSNAERFALHVFRLANWRATRRALRATGAEVLLFANLSLVSLAPIVAARCAGVPTLGFVCDPWPENHWIRWWRADEEARRAKAGRLRTLERLWSAVRSTVDLGHLVVPSESMRRAFAADGLPPETIEVVRQGLDPELARRASGAAPAARSPDEPLRVLSTSMLWEGKGVHVLLEAARLAREGGLDLELAIAGDGGSAYVERLRALAEAPALAGRVRFAGLLDREGLARELGRAHVHVFASVWGEPFASAPIEAMAFGCALVASDAGGTPELFEDGVEGISVPAGDARALARALGELAADEERRARLARAGRERALTRFTQVHFLDGIEAALERVAAS